MFYPRLERGFEGIHEFVVSMIVTV